MDIADIITKVIIAINRQIDNLSKNTLENIRNLFIVTVVIFAIGGITVGVINGKKNAHKFGESIAPTTNSVFEFMAKQQREDGNFTSMLKSEMLEEIKLSGAEKKQAPSNENSDPESNTAVLETESARNAAYPVKENNLNKERPQTAENNLPVDNNGNSRLNKSEHKRSIETKELQPLNKTPDIIK